jgi:GPI mannosyltransferase 3
MKYPLIRWWVIVSVACFRCWNAYWLNGQFDPDEYWQTLEPAYCYTFGIWNTTTTTVTTTSIPTVTTTIPNNNRKGGKIQNDRTNTIYNGDICSSSSLTWEWTRRWEDRNGKDIHFMENNNSTITTTPPLSMLLSKKIWMDIWQHIMKFRHGPLRSHMTILPTYYLYQILKVLHWDTIPILISHGPRILHALLVVTPIDIMIAWLSGRYFMTTRTSTAFSWALICSLTSWFHAYAMIRTYSNSWEALLLLMGCVLLLSSSDDDDDDEDDPGDPHDDDNITNHNNNNNRHGPISHVALAFALGGISMAIRVTSVAAWIPLFIIHLSTQFNSPSVRLTWSRMSIYLLYPCLTFGLLGLFVTFLMDRIFYGFWSIPLIANFQFNVLDNGAALYGTHPHYWYLVIGIPVVGGCFVPIWIYGAISPHLTTFRNHPRTKELLFIILSYIICHSCSSHQEFRFLLPILPLGCILAGGILSNMESPRIRRRIGICMILIHGIVWFLVSFGHQRASLEVPRYLVQTISKEVASTYMSLSENDTMPSTIPTFHIHYLVDCHAVPSFSHVHVGSHVSLTMKHLTCPPSCRWEELQQPQTPVCDTTRMSKDPESFVTKWYSSSSDNLSFKNSITWTVLYARDAKVVGPRLETLGFVQNPMSFYQSIVGVTLFGYSFGSTMNSLYSTKVWTSWLQFHMEEMVVWERRFLNGSNVCLTP